MRKLSLLAALLLLTMLALPALAADEPMPGQTSKEQPSTGQPGMGQPSTGQKGPGQMGTMPSSPETPSVVALGDTEELEAKIVEIDKHDRTVTLQGPEGKTITVKADSKVANFSELKVGDKIKARFFRGVIFSVGAREAATPGFETITVQAPAGKEPGELKVAQITTQATVESVDAAKHTVTLKGSEGISRTFNVGENVDLSKLKAGDTITASYILGIALRLEKE